MKDANFICTQKSSPGAGEWLSQCSACHGTMQTCTGSLELMGKNNKKTLITVAHTYNPNVRSAATGRSLGLTVQPA